MRALLLVAALALLPPAVAQVEGASVMVVDATLDEVSTGAVDLNDRYRATLTVENVGGDGHVVLVLNSYWHFYTYPVYVDYTITSMEAGETSTYVIEGTLQDNVGHLAGPMWLCAEASSTHLWDGRCWSIWYGPMPDGVYPRDLPHPTGLPHPMDE